MMSTRTAPKAAKKGIRAVAKKATKADVQSPLKPMHLGPMSTAVGNPKKGPGPEAAAKAAHATAKKGSKRPRNRSRS